jgi:hypothetical protein
MNRKMHLLAFAANCGGFAASGLSESTAARTLAGDDP